MARSSGSESDSIMNVVKTSITLNDLALSHPEMIKLIRDNNTRFDMVIVPSFLANEAGYYLAHKFKAQLGLYFSGQVSFE